MLTTLRQAQGIALRQGTVKGTALRAPTGKLINFGVFYSQHHNKAIARINQRGYDGTSYLHTGEIFLFTSGARLRPADKFYCSSIRRWLEENGVTP